MHRSRAQQASKDAYQYMAGSLDMTETEWELLRRWYDGEIAYIDTLVGDLLDYLKSEGMYEDTLVMVTSDHGELFGEHGLVYHQFSLAEELINVPLLIKWPNEHDQEGSEELVSLIDLAPTMLDAAGLSPPEAMQGRRLRSDPELDAVFAEFGYPRSKQIEGMERRGVPWRQYDKALEAVRTKTIKLVRDSNGEKELFPLVFLA